MSTFFDSACFQISFFDGELLKLDYGLLSRRFEHFKIREHHKIRKRRWVKNFVQGIPDWTTYDFYHNKVQEIEIEKLLKNESEEILMKSFKQQLFWDGPRKIEHFQQLKLKAIELFGLEHIKKTCHQIQKETTIVKNSYFNPKEFYTLIEEINKEKRYSTVFKIQDKEIRKRMNVFDQRKLKKTRRKAICDTTGNQNSPIRLKTQNNLALEFSDLQNFVNQIPTFVSKRSTLKEMYLEFRRILPSPKKLSLSSFYQRFVRNQDLVYKKPKICHSLFNQRKKQRLRKFNCFIIDRILCSEQTLYFYDETTIDSKMCFSKVWSLKGMESIRFVKAPIKYFKLNIVCTFSRIVSFSLTTESFHTQKVAEFLQATAELVQKNSKNTKTMLLLLDNGPKNRSKGCKRLWEQNQIRFVYTTPTTPQHNYCECLFQVIKAKLNKHPGLENDAAHGISEKQLFNLVMMVLTELDENDFGKARRSYFHELKTLF